MDGTGRDGTVRGRRAGPDLAGSDAVNLRVVFGSPGGAGRAALEAFVAAEYLRAYGARIDHFLPTLMGVETPGGLLVGAIGVREGSRPGGFFLERYLDGPAEARLAAVLGGPVRRASLAEVGNLAGAVPGVGRVLVGIFAAYLRALGLEWAVFTSTRPLRNLFRGLGVDLVDLGAADGDRLGAESALWGTYYATEPRVVAARIERVEAATRDHPRLAAPLRSMRDLVPAPGGAPADRGA